MGIQIEQIQQHTDQLAGMIEEYLKRLAKEYKPPPPPQNVKAVITKKCLEYEKKIQCVRYIRINSQISIKRKMIIKD